MSAVTIDHDEDSPNCHHCHITTPIPFSQLIKTHPLRSPSPDEEDADEIRPEPATGFQLNEQSRQASVKSKSQLNTRPIEARHNGNLIQNLLEEVANHEFHRRKKRSNSLTSEERVSTHNSSRSKEEPHKLVHPVHSFLHHVSERSIYKATEQPSSDHHRNLQEERSSSLEPESVRFKKSGSRSSSPNLILNPSSVNSLPIECASPINQENSFSRINSPSPIRTSITQLNGTTAWERGTFTKIVHIKDSETQTSKSNTISRATLGRIRVCASRVSSAFSGSSSRKGKKKCGAFACTLPSGLLFAGYGLLVRVIIAIG